MDEFVKNLTNNWKEIIESINIDGETRKVESINFFEMTQPSWRIVFNNFIFEMISKKQTCYKVTFNFVDGLSPSGVKITKQWHEKLESTFFDMFNSNDKLKRDNPVVYNNSKVDYMTNQGHRFIIQFYPKEFLSDVRNKKLESLGI